ncbi:MAG: tripartite tricarboxylate transporter TctB family protein [Deltaproteobacteria bacterium]|jgi:hypothetical protein|nr:tripartite tricarboxylate transporter TctB family protein [Deltaproteobacteria bacterium]
MKKESMVNTDFWGAAIMFVFAAGFYSQLDPEFTYYAAFFPKHLLPCLIIIGVGLIIKGFVSPTIRPSFISQTNATLAYTVIVGLLWVFTLDWLGFLITSFAAIFALLVRFDPVRSPKTMFKSVLIAAGEVAVIYVGFVKLLYVTMPEGRLFL